MESYRMCAWECICSVLELTWGLDGKVSEGVLKVKKKKKNFSLLTCLISVNFNAVPMTLIFRRGIKRYNIIINTKITSYGDKWLLDLL